MKDQGAKKVVVMGGDLGATEAFYAASKGMKVDGIVSVSGLNDSEGYDIDKAVLQAAGGPTLFIAGKDDTDAFDAYREWLPEAPGPKQGLLLDTDTRGTFLFDPILPTDIPLQHKAFAAALEFLKTND
jgi:pimeloyl-ACP methyl ester carboxylesterase